MPPASGSALQEQVAELLAARVDPGGPGLAVGVYRDGQLVEQVCAGLASVEHGVPIGADTRFDIASASKQFTAAGLLMLQRDGVLELSDDVRKHLPELTLSAPVTLRQCLTHTGGLREYYTLCEISGVPLAGITEDRLLRLIEGQRDLDFEPGAEFSYSNTGYVLATVVLRRVTGMSLRAFAADRVFGRLGMSRTSFRDDLALIVPGLATGYAPAPGPGGRGFHRADPIEEVVGDGGIVTSLRELAGWHRFLVSGHGLGADIREGLLDRMVLTDGTVLPYANGIEHTTVAGRPAFGHTGAISGFRSVILCIPEESLGVTVLANRTDIYPALAARWVARLALGSPAQAGGTDPVDPETALAARPGLLGTWHDPLRDLYVRLEPGSDGRVEQPTGSERGRFARAADGRWYGEGAEVGVAYALDGERLLLRPAYEDDEDLGTFERAPSPPRSVAAPAGSYYSDELAAYVTFDPDGGSDPTVTIGLGKPLPLALAGPDVYSAGDTLTLRFADGGRTLLVSAAGARRIRFSRLPAGSVPPRQMRGLV